MNWINIDIDIDINSIDTSIDTKVLWTSLCKTNSVSTQTQEVWHEESDQEHMSEDMQQAVIKKSSSAAAINADQRRDQNSVSRDMIERQASEKSISTQDTAQQIKIAVRSREIWVKAARNQRIRTCYNQAACSSSQNRECSDYLNKNRQN